VSEPLLRLHGSAALSGSQALHLQRADFALSQFVEIGFLDMSMVKALAQNVSQV
jgi:hypothetical protein